MKRGELVDTYFRVREIAKSSLPDNNIKRALADAKLYNARARVSSQWMKLADRVPVPEYKQICTSYASTVLAGREVFPLPEAGEKLLQAKDIGAMFGITANMVGKLAKANNLKVDEFGKWVHDKSPYSVKEVETFRYNAHAVEKFKELISKSP